MVNRVIQKLKPGNCNNSVTGWIFRFNITAPRVWMGASVLTVLFGFHPVLGQRNCATVDYNQMLHDQKLINETPLQFENWIQQKIEDKRSKLPSPLYNDPRLLKAELVQIPVVVHVIHNGEQEGTGSNISLSQIQSQIEVLNEDFRRQNGDASQTPGEFTPVAADSEIEFILAKQDPEGLASTGILRLAGSQSSWSFNDGTKLKSESYWPAENYLNIWVAPLSGGLLGFAQFPVSNLPGLEESSENQFTDGIVISYEFFGSIDKDPLANLESPFNKGRTTTHEVGHFLGLRHVWGDGDCSFDDFVSDTPFASSETNGCPSDKSSCSTNDMFQNYMDYTDDACMNLFTLGQKDRMRVVLDSSPRRGSLLTSNGLLDPVLVADDMGIKEIVTPQGGICEPTLSPLIKVRNYGTNDVSSLVVEFYIDGQLFEQRSETVSLSPLEEYNMIFDEIAISQTGETDFEFIVIEVNGGQDGNGLNDRKSTSVNIPDFITLPHYQSFEPIPAGWQLRNDDGLYTWENVQAPTWEISNQCMRLAYYNDDNIGEEDMIVTPLFDLSQTSEAHLLFDRAYAYIPGFNNDKLQVAISTDCGQTFDQLIFDKSGSDLNTSSRTDTHFFVPSGRVDWVRESISLNFFAGTQDVMLGFRGVNGNGNNLYLDNITVVKNTFFDAGVKTTIEPQVATCNDRFNPVIEIENLGTEVFSDYQIHYSINGGPISIMSVSGPNIGSGDVSEIALDEILLPGGLNELSVEVQLPGDIITENNQVISRFLSSCTKESLPLRENFVDFGLASALWKSLNKDGDAVQWQKAASVENAVVISNFQVSEHGLRDYLVSPILDLTQITKASLFFDYSYAFNPELNAGESFRVLVSTDNGQSFEEELYTKSGSALSVMSTEAEWIPSVESDWVEGFINLSDYAGQEIVLGFEITGRSSNNFYLKNLEFFADDDPNPLSFMQKVRIYPNPSTNGKFNMTFNLETKEEVVIQVIDRSGKTVFSRQYHNILNQTIPFNLAGQSAGLFILQSRGESFVETHRIFIRQ